MLLHNTWSPYNVMLVSCSWIFNVFDEDGGGTIDKEEVKSVVVKLLTNMHSLLCVVTNDYFVIPCFHVAGEQAGGEPAKADGGPAAAAAGGGRGQPPVLCPGQPRPSSRGGQEVTMCVQAILEAMDEDGNGTISKEEFVNNALKIEFIRNILMAQESSAAGE